MRTFLNLLVLAFCMASLGSTGCSLIVQFDRDRIVADAGVDAPSMADAGNDTPTTPDAPILDVATDVTVLDTPMADAPMADAPMDAASDAPVDAPIDAPPDVPMMDAGTDAGTPTTQCNDGMDNDGDGTTDLTDPGCADMADDDEGGACPAGGATCPECNNGMDDDADTMADFPMDPGCSSAADNDESA